MEITLSEKQFEKLLKLVYLGMWIAEADESPGNDYFTEIEQLVYSQAKNLSGSTPIQFEEDSKKYYPTIDFDKDDIIAHYIDTYDENCFWEELIDRLTKRDMIRKYGLEKINTMSQEEIIKKEQEFTGKYETVFEESGILKLFIQNDNEQ